ncbi:MAG: DUF1553 domain-containing protein [Acidobacteria bacterium]|nr:DUF1553 domain-containing protein [Acidobacteriota bacterium]
MPRRVAALLLLVVGSAFGATGPEVLHTRCLQCHNADTAMSELRLDSRDGALAGGKRGAAVVPGSPDSSLLFRAVSHQAEPHMPPTGKLDAAEIAVLRDWIAAGAKWDAAAISAAPRSEWWAFQAPEAPAVPEVAGVSHPVDAFVAAKLAEQGLQPAPPADRRTLIRRATFDLHGLPASYDETKAFESDPAGDDEAWKALVEKLLASERYGEKWGRHWLDLVRYGDTSGFEQDPYNLEAWRYRDYVIDSFNQDKPYDRFVKEQLAGDEIWPEDPAARTGTGYYRVNANRDMLFKVEEQNRYEKLADYVDTTSKVFLALTVGCARCHDHKFDPIPQKDFYRMQAIFAPAVNDRVFLEYNSARFYDLAWNTRDFKLRNIADHLRAIYRPYEKKLRDEKLRTLPDGAQVIEAFETAKEKRSPEQEELVTENEELAKVGDDEVRAAMSASDAEQLDALERRLVSLFKGYGPPNMAPGVIDVGRESPRTYLAIRGNPEAPGEEVGPGYLTALGGGDIPDPPLHVQTTYRRKHLAEWIARPENPLTARVMVNRIWQFHFGEGLVETPSDFGTRATRVSNRELLDWLAVQFVESGWSVKAMHRLIMSSETYRRSSVAPAGAAEKDPANRYLSHFNRRRLQAEEIRDATLFASGKLNLEMGGEPVVVPLDQEELYGITGTPSDRWVVTWDPKQHTRRSVYLLQRRAFQHPMFQVFDAPDGMTTCERRNESTTAPQSLTLLNSRFMVDQSQALADEAPTVEQAWRMSFGRDPRPEEKAAAQSFLSAQQKRLGDAERARAELARSLLNSNEFLYVD